MLARRSNPLIIAFAALLTIGGAAGWAVWDRATATRAVSASIHDQETSVREALNEIRSQVYLTAILARDYLLDDAPSREEYLSPLEMHHGRVEAAMTALRASAPEREMQAALHKLATEVDGYFDVTHELLVRSIEERARRMEETLQSRGVRRREILTLAAEIQDLSARASAHERAHAEAEYDQFRSSLGWIAGFALLAGTAIAGFAMFRVRILERQSDAAEDELRSLSGQLRAAQEQERKSLSRELHDQVGQVLTGLRMELAAISRSRSIDQQTASSLDRARLTVEQTLGIVRNIAMLLRPSMLDDLGLVPALNWLVKEVSRSSAMDIRRDIDPEADALPEAHRTCIYRVVQEALTNALKHSGASVIEVRVKMSEGHVRTWITDDGRGFQAPIEKRKGTGSPSLGLLGMEERVRELGGELRIHTGPGRGTSIEIVLPHPVGREVTNDQSIARGRSRDRANGVKAAV